MADNSDIPQGRGRMVGKTVMVYGGGSILPGWGNGKAAAVLYAVEGAKVFVVDARLEAAKETVDIIRSVGGEAEASAGDAMLEADVVRTVKECADTFGSINVLHNNIGGQGTGRSLDNITLDDWNDTIARNVTTAMLTSREVVPHMLKAGGGAIVNIASIAGIRHLGVPTAVYSTGKGAVISLTQNIALHYAKQNIRANCVLPGYIDTPFINRLINGKPGYTYKGFDNAEDYAAARNAIIPMGRMGTGWDVAHCSLFLASDDAAYVTGTTLVVDGGVTATCPGV